LRNVLVGITFEEVFSLGFHKRFFFFGKLRSVFEKKKEKKKLRNIFKKIKRKQKKPQKLSLLELASMGGGCHPSEGHPTDLVNTTLIWRQAPWWLPNRSLARCVCYANWPHHKPPNRLAVTVMAAV
jgi:hypothetical protein